MKCTGQKGCPCDKCWSADSIDIEPSRNGTPVPKVKSKTKREGKLYCDTIIEVGDYDITIHGLVAAVKIEKVR